MKEILERLHSPAWWFDFVVVAFVIGVAASYGRVWIARIRQRLGAAASDFQKQITAEAILAARDHHQELRARLDCILHHQHGRFRLCVAFLAITAVAIYGHAGNWIAVFLIPPAVIIAWSGFRHEAKAARLEFLCQIVAQVARATKREKESHAQHTVA